MERTPDCPACRGKLAPVAQTQSGPAEAPEKPLEVECTGCGRKYPVLDTEFSEGFAVTIYTLGDEQRS